MMINRYLAILTLALGIASSAAPARAVEATDAAGAFAVGVAAFEAKRFDAAAEYFQQASAAAPQSAKYLHWLGRAYGRLAEQSSWLAAMDLARKTCNTFERAFALDPNDIGTVEDLIAYYTEAPSFLGGNRRKAEILKQHLETLQHGAAQTVSAEQQTGGVPVQTR